MITTSEGSLLAPDGRAALESEKASKMAGALALKFISLDVLALSLLAPIVAGAAYVLEEMYPKAGTTKAAADLQVHVIMGIVLGLLLAGRIFLGSLRAYQAADCKSAFCKECRTIALLATTVTETLTIAEGAEAEKTAVAEFRLELVRYLNLSWYLFKGMMLDVKVVKPPPALKKKAGGTYEMQMLTTVPNPTLMCVKFMSELLQAQQTAGRIAASNASLFWGSFTKLVTVYHDTQALQLSAPSVALEGICKVFTVLWVYTLCPVLAITMQSANAASEASPGFEVGGFIPTLFGSFIIGLFFFGLLSAGSLVEKPVKAMLAITDLEAMTVVLSQDLANLVDDPDGEVPVFLPSPSYVV